MLTQVRKDRNMHFQGWCVEIFRKSTVDAIDLTLRLICHNKLCVSSFLMAHQHNTWQLGTSIRLAVAFILLFLFCLIDKYTY